MIFPPKRSKSECKLRVKKRVLGAGAGGLYRAHPLAHLRKVGRARDRSGSTTVEIIYDAAADWASARFDDGSLAPAFVVYWFARQAFRPETDCLPLQSTR